MHVLYCIYDLSIEEVSKALLLTSQLRLLKRDFISLTTLSIIAKNKVPRSRRILLSVHSTRTCGGLFINWALIISSRFYDQFFESFIVSHSLDGFQRCIN